MNAIKLFIRKAQAIYIVCRYSKFVVSYQAAETQHADEIRRVVRTIESSKKDRELNAALCITSALFINPTPTFNN